MADGDIKWDRDMTIGLILTIVIVLAIAGVVVLGVIL